MKADKRFLNQPLEFWANIKLISKKGGYTDKKTKHIKVHTIDEIKKVFESNDLDYSKLIDKNDKFTDYGKLIVAYLQHRSDVLRTYVEPRLMKVDEAKKLFAKLKKQYKPTCALPLNKQTGDKKGYAFLTGIVNMIIEANSKSFDCE